MHQRIIRYKVKPGQEDANAELARAVYAELSQINPDGLSYATFRLDEDPLSFVHVVRSLHTPNPLLAVKAFGEFQAGITERSILRLQMEWQRHLQKVRLIVEGVLQLGWNHFAALECLPAYEFRC